MAFKHPDWSYSSNIYEVNIRQYTAEGNFKSFIEHLPRLKDMNVEILWLMPIMPISIVDRKGTLGSYYAVKDYCSVNPEFGTLEDFKDLVSHAHELGFKIILDWVANHTGNDHSWLVEHPEFYERDENNQVVHPNDWSDVSHLTFDCEGTRVAMINMMRFWIDECNIDGFRCDMAHLVPLDFWFRAHTELEASTGKDLFWLAECEEPNYHNAFDATYTWEWMHATEQFYQQAITLTALEDILNNNAKRFHPDAFRVYFTSNHDENSWNGTEYEKFREMALPLAVFSCTWNGLPMIYSGQELPNYKRLKFFEKDVITWTHEIKLHNFYKALLALKKRNPAMLAGTKSSTEWLLPVNDAARYMAYRRKNEEDEVIVLINFSAHVIYIPLEAPGTYHDIFSGNEKELMAADIVSVDGWRFKVLEKV